MYAALALLFFGAAFACFVKFASQSIPPRVSDPWTVVCGESGKFSFTDAGGYVFPQQYDSPQEAAWACDAQRHWAESRQEQRDEMAKTEWTACPRPIQSAATAPTPMPSPSPTVAEQLEQLAYKNGWMAYAFDSIAIDEYHFRADALENDDDMAALAAIWEQAKENARAAQEDWERLPIDRKLATRAEPFWNSNRGEPRRISRSGRRKFREALTGKPDPPL